MKVARNLFFIVSILIVHQPFIHFTFLISYLKFLIPYLRIILSINTGKELPPEQQLTGRDQQSMQLIVIRHFL